jgi:OmpA-OmpF porin, OOP family
MRRPLLLLAALASALPSLAAGGDKADCKDHPLFPSRMPQYELSSCRTQEFGTYDFATGPGKKAPVEGRFTELTYSFTGARGQEPSALAIVRNYENAITRVGGTVVFSDPNRWVTGKVVKDGQEAWFQAERGNGKIWLRVVEKKAMNQYVVADAAAFANDIQATGHAAVYGILFDTGKSELKPESKPALEEITRLLAKDPAMKVLVVGHTDMVGSIDANMKLSQARAEAVVQALVGQHGVAPARLKGYGVGPLCPVSTNGTEEGRARNRRVELVKE